MSCMYVCVYGFAVAAGQIVIWLGCMDIEQTMLQNQINVKKAGVAKKQTQAKIDQGEANQRKYAGQ